MCSTSRSTVSAVRARVAMAASFHRRLSDRQSGSRLHQA
jgi:hypothetical protein